MSAEAWTGRRLHLIGVGGAGMSGLALVARALGGSISGSDRAASPQLERLAAAGVEVFVGHDAGNVPPDAEVVVSTAIADDNPELAAARARGQEVLHRSDLLAEVSRLRRCVAIAGTHGKTTTASMAAHVLVACGRDPGYLIGGELRSTETNAAWGSGAWLIIEADESDRSFLKLTPELAVITNVELDHHSTYASLAEVETAFESFAAGAGRTLALAGLEVASVDETFGIHSGDLAASDVELGADGSSFSVGDERFSLLVPGRHNVLNGLAALGACRAAGISDAEAAAALATFPGARRRFERHGRSAGGAEVYDDYAHHPTEVRATLEAARTFSPRRLVAVFQPHLYSRTRRLAGEFGSALALADVVVVLDIYPARESASDYPGVSGLDVARATADAASGRRVVWAPTLDDAQARLESLLEPGDMLLTLGAGDVDRIALRLTGSPSPR